MFREIAIVFLFLIILSSFGCEKASQNKQFDQIKKETQQTQFFVVPQFELIETPKYKELKKQVEESQETVNELETKRASLLVIYTEESYEFKKVSVKLAATVAKLKKLKNLLNEETEKLQSQQKNPLV